MNESMLFYTAVPLLLGHPREAGRLAARLSIKHGVTCRFVGQGTHPLLWFFGARRALPLLFTPENDPLLIRFLLDFAKEQRPIGGILCLIPCSPEAEAALSRVRERLEETFVILPRPAAGENPLYGLVHAH